MSNNSLYWYVLFVQTGREEEIINLLKKESTHDQYFKPFLFKTVHVFRRQGKKSLFHKTCFPGYIFIESNEVPDEFISRTLSVVYPLKYVYKILHYGDNKVDAAMHENERAALSTLFGKEYCADISQGFKSNDCIKIISGPLVDYESKILKFNRSRQEAVVSVNMFGKPIEVLMGLDILKNKDDVAAM